MWFIMLMIGLICVGVAICCPILCICCCYFSEPQYGYESTTTTTVTRQGVTHFVNECGGPDMVFNGPVHGTNQPVQGNQNFYQENLEQYSESGNYTQSN